MLRSRESSVQAMQMLSNAGHVSLASLGSRAFVSFDCLHGSRAKSFSEAVQGLSRAGLKAPLPRMSRPSLALLYGPPPGFDDPETTWKRRFAARARRVEDVLRRPQFQYLQYRGCRPEPPSTTERIANKSWDRIYKFWRDGGDTMAACMGYERPS